MFWAKPKGTFRPYQTPEPQPRGAVTRRAVAKRRSRASGLTRLSAEAIRGAVLCYRVFSKLRLPYSPISLLIGMFFWRGAASWPPAEIG